MKILIVDNNDSFTYNIVELIRSISSYRIHVKYSDSIDIHKVKEYERIIFSPGPGLPHEFPTMSEILTHYENEIPILGICLGHQAICEFYGAKLSNLPKVVHGQPKRLFVKKNEKLFNKLPQNFTVGLYHSWIVKKNGFPDVLRVTGFSEDNNILSIEHKQYEIYGIQFHPESYITEYGKQLMANFLKPEGL